jgi:hypothetical protein
MLLFGAMNTFNLDNTVRLAMVASVTLSLGVFFSLSAKAADFTLDFDAGSDYGDVLTNLDGTLVTTQWATWGLTNISGFNDRTNQVAKLMTYDTNRTGGQDPDLQTGNAYGTPTQGKALIIQEEDRTNKNYFNNNGFYRPDDEANGGYIDFDFAEKVAFKSFSLLDIDDNGSGIRVEGYDPNGTKVLDIDIDALIAKHKTDNGSNAAAAQGTSVTLNGVTLTQVGTRRGDNSLFRFDVDDTYLTNVRFNYPGSGAISGLAWSTEDGPAPVPEPSVMGGLLMVGALGTRRYLKRRR